MDEDRIARVTLTPVPGPRVRVAFPGDPLPAGRRDALVTVAREGSADEDLLEDSSNNIEEYLRSQGYRDATAPHRREESDGELLITFTLKRGSLYRVSRVEISGNRSVPLEDFASGLRVRPASRLPPGRSTRICPRSRTSITAAVSPRREPRPPSNPPPAVAPRSRCRSASPSPKMYGR